MSAPSGIPLASSATNENSAVFPRKYIKYVHTFKESQRLNILRQEFKELSYQMFVAILKKNIFHVLRI